MCFLSLGLQKQIGSEQIIFALDMWDEDDRVSLSESGEGSGAERLQAHE